ncbi:heme/hemin ABC transporter substrate-binding protein [Roseibium aggregatum]|uniref:ABC transporter substrate-binding protein n=1 Tax=Roseibium aggregatum TaxID=187304 RepID=A0A939EI08_9HYPH|nr:ABC transporter substrate-binding protein [Roseibium aggregatum]MBN9671934.1 ABC transporter substrate-binding protein [Roseibium aggregatum]
MIFYKPSKLLGLAAATALSVAALVTPGETLFAEDDGTTSASRIVSVGGSVTEIVFALGEQDRLIARDTTSIYPETANALPDVGYMRALSPEGVMSVDPDLILLLDGSGPPETVGLLEKSGIPVRNIPDEFTARGIVEKVRAVGAALGVEDKAGDLVQKLEADLEAAHAEASGQSEGLRVLFVLSTRGGSIMASGSDTAADGILELAGAQNAIDGFSGYKQLTDEAILSAAPDVVLMMDRVGDHVAGGDELFNHPALARTPAGENKRLIRMPGQYLLGFGPRTADAIRDLAARLADIRS